VVDVAAPFVRKLGIDAARRVVHDTEAPPSHEQSVAMSLHRGCSEANRPASLGLAMRILDRRFASEYGDRL